jgi:hypothetical protein
MAVRRKTSPDTPLGPGVYVRSVAIGRKAEFEGVIVRQVAGGWEVKDLEKNSHWHRAPRELEVIDRRDDGVSVQPKTEA